MFRISSAILPLCGAILVLSVPVAQAGDYTYMNLGVPPGADSVIGVRMNNLGHVAGWSQYYGQGEPSLKGWVWTPDNGFTILPPPPGFFLGRSRAMDINDNGVVAGDGGFDIGLAWRYENGVYEVTGEVEGMPIAYLGGINESGDLAGTGKDAQIITPDYAFLDLNGGALLSLTPNGGRATDVNNNGQVCGYLNPVSGPFQAYRWDSASGIQLLGTLGLAYSFANRMNDGGGVVGYALSASGNTQRAWIYTDQGGQQELPAPFQNSSTAIGINNQGHVIGMTAVSGPDISWLWTGGDSVTNVNTLFDPVGENVNLISVNDINNAGQILARVFDNNVAEFRTVVLSPPAADCSCLGDFDGDAAVTFADLAVFLDCLGQPGGGCACGDFDGDQSVTFADLVSFLTVLETGECG